jgi:hypothetical protein
MKEEGRIRNEATKSQKEDAGVLLRLVKTDSAPGRLGRSDELLDRFEDHRELTRDLQVARPHHHATKGAHDRDIYFDGARAAQHAGEHWRLLVQ